MNRRWASTLFWSFFFAAGIYFSSKIVPTEKQYPLGHLLGLHSVKQLEQQTHFTHAQRVKQAESTPSVTSPTPEGLRVDEYAAILREDRICDFVNSHVNRDTKIQAFLENTRNPFLNTLLGPNGPMSGNPNYDAHDDPVIFYNALLFSNLIAGEVRQPAPDYAYAEKLFRDLESHSPDNGAYFLFHAYAAAKAGRSLKEQHVLILKAIQAAEFDTFLITVTKELHSVGRINPTLWLAAIGLWSTTPIPSYPPAKFINTLLENGTPQIHELAVNFGKKLIESDRTIPIEKAIGRLVLEASWAKAYPRQPVPDLRSKILKKRNSRKERLYSKAFDLVNGPNCDRRLLDEYFSAFKDDEFTP